INFIHGNVDFLEDYVGRLMRIVEVTRSLPESASVSTSIAPLANELEIDYVRTDLPKLLAAVRAGAERVARIVRDLRTFSRLGSTELQDADLNSGVAMTLNLIAPQAKGRVK